MAASIVSSFCIADPNIAAGSKGRGGGVSRADSSVVVDTVRVSRNGLVQRSVVAECGGRGALQCGNPKVGLGGQRGLRVGWAEEQAAMRADHARGSGGRRRAAVAPQADFEARPESKVTFVPLELIDSEVCFDRVVREAQQRNEPIVIEWMATWCRKCLYLKPKLEKLAALFHPSIKFYYVDVNSVPQSLVRRAEVTQMPTIQLWRNGAQEAQVIGGQQANTVVDLVQDMIGKGMPRG